MKNIPFGIEIELTGITRKKATLTIAQYFGTGSEYKGGTYDAYHVPDKQGRCWKVMSDSSIYTQKKISGKMVRANNLYAVELVSPVLSYDDITMLQEVVRVLRKAGAVANDSTGIHIHVDASGFTPTSLRNLINIMTSKEDMLYSALNITAERQKYCQKMNKQMVDAINHRKPATLNELSDIWYKEQDAESDRNYHYNSSRYHILNLHSTFTKGTVEFRLFDSTTHAGKVKAYIQFVLAVAKQAQTLKYASAKKPVTDNPKYTFRCWLLRLKLIGDEFKTCRKHMLALLDGDSAWRHGKAV